MLLRVPIDGTRQIAANPNILRNGSKSIDAGFIDILNLAMNYTGVTMKNCQKFATWYNWGDTAKHTDAWDPDHTKHLVKIIDLNNTDKDVSLVNQYKLQLMNISNLVLLTIWNHITVNSFKYLFPHNTDFCFVDSITRALNFDGLIFLRLCILTSKPDTIIDVCDLEM